MRGGMLFFFLKQFIYPTDVSTHVDVWCQSCGVAADPFGSGAVSERNQLQEHPMHPTFHSAEENQ